MGLRIRISARAGIPRFSLITFLILSLNDFTDVFDGLMTKLPLYLRTFWERKSNPSLMFVILDFSGESWSPLCSKKSFTKGMILWVMISLLSAVITKSSEGQRAFALWWYYHGSITIRLITNRPLLCSTSLSVASQCLAVMVISRLFTRTKWERAPGFHVPL